MSRNEQDLADEWISEHRSEYIELQQEVSMKDSTPTSSRKADIVGVVSDDNQRRVVDVFEVKELRDWHVETDPEDGPVRFLLSDKYAEWYNWIRDQIARAGFVNVTFDYLNEIADEFLEFLTMDFGPVSVSIGLLGLAISELMGRVAVTGYEVVRDPPIYGQGRYGHMAFGKGGYSIEPRPLS